MNMFSLYTLLLTKNLGNKDLTYYYKAIKFIDYTELWLRSYSKVLMFLEGANIAIIVSQ